MPGGSISGIAVWLLFTVFEISRVVRIVGNASSASAHDSRMLSEWSESYSRLGHVEGVLR